MASKAQGVYVDAGTYPCRDRKGERIAGVGAKAEAGVVRVCVEQNGERFEARGPNAGASAEACERGISAMTRAELGAVSVESGPVNAKIGLGIDTGASIGSDGVEAKFLGCGVSLGRKTSVAVFGTEIGLSFW